LPPCLRPHLLPTATFRFLSQKPIIKRALDAFTSHRLHWGGLGPRFGPPQTVGPRLPGAALASQCLALPAPPRSGLRPSNSVAWVDFKKNQFKTNPQQTAKKFGRLATEFAIGRRPSVGDPRPGSSGLGQNRKYQSSIFPHPPGFFGWLTPALAERASLGTPLRYSLSF